MPLVKPLPNSEVPADLSDFFAITLGVTPNSIRTMSHRPAIASAFTNLNRAVMENHGELTSELKRLIGYIASTTSGCRYCQAHTTLAATRFGTTDARLNDIWKFRESEHFSAAEKVAFELAIAAASVPNAVDKALQERLQEHWSDGDIVEIMAVIALFGYLNRWNDSMATTLEQAPTESAEEHLAERGWRVGKHARER
ncbi:MAG: carboxymuconolactone decarboxylase family protein [Pseudomonadota bacterium]